jgi:hypothetical protein
MKRNIFSRELKIQHLNGEIFPGKIHYFRVDDVICQWNLQFTSPVTKKLEAINNSMFECLIDLRRELAKYSYKPLCNGARKNIVLSGMCGDMGEGFAGYLVQQGQEININDLVEVLDYAEPSLVVSVEEQEVFREQWLYPKGRNIPKKYKLQILNERNEAFDGELLIFENLKSFRIKFRSSLTPIFTCSGEDFSECFTKLWRDLSGIGFTPLCNGARTTAHVFLCEKRMLGANQVHILEFGKIPSSYGGLYIFDYAEPSLTGSIEEQDFFYRSWLDSIKPICGNHNPILFEEIFFRFVHIGDLLKMWLFEINSRLEGGFTTALSPLSPEDVDRIGELKPEAIVGFFNQYVSPHAENLIVNKTFVCFMHQVFASKAFLDIPFQSAATQQQDGWIYVIDERGAEDPLPEDIIGSFEVQGGQIVVNSYQPNDNYAIIGKKGLFQLTPFLSKALIGALKAL